MPDLTRNSNSLFVTYCSCYRPQRSCEGYVFTGVCLSTRGVSDSVHAGIPHPLPQSRHLPGSRPPWSRHPPSRADTPQEQEQTPPLEQTPPDQTHPLREQTPPGADTPPGPDTPRDTATAADGTHPTGMHSCSLWKTPLSLKS